MDKNNLLTRLKLIKIEVVYGTDETQQMINLAIPLGTTIKEAIHLSGLLSLFPIDLTYQKVGIYGKQKKLDELVKDGDRIEIYRPLLIDPKEARRKKAN